METINVTITIPTPTPGEDRRGEKSPKYLQSRQTKVIKGEISDEPTSAAKPVRLVLLVPKPE